MPTDASESLTLDTQALSRAQLVLMATNADEGLEHDCSDWTDDDDDGCGICWEIAGRVLRAAEGLRLCSRCRGTGDIGYGAAVCCPECGGNGLEALPDD